MADITMCNSTTCPMRNNCYRTRAKMSEYGQYYFETPPYDAEKDECDYFWPYTPNNNYTKKQNA